MMFTSAIQQSKCLKLSEEKCGTGTAAGPAPFVATRKP
jgi:hypothetical protein